MYGQFLVIFALIFTGYFGRRIGIIGEAMNQSLNKFIVYFAFPCFIFQKMAALEMNEGLLSEFFLAFVISAILFLLYGLYAWGYGRLRGFPRNLAASAELVTVFPNNAFMGFPIAYIFFGEQGLFFMLANNIAMNLTIFSYGAFALHRGEDGGGFSARALVKCVLNPNILGLALGLLACYFKWNLPETLDTYLAYVGGLCTPMSMLFIGSTMVGSSLKSIVRDRMVVESALSKNIALPLLTLLLLVFLPLPPMLIAIVVFANAFPSAAVATVLVETEGGDGDLACRILVLSTALSLVSLPAAVQLIHMIVL